MRTHAPDHVEAAEPAALHGEIDDHHVGMVAAVEAIAGRHVARLEHGRDTRVLQHAPAALQDDRMIVDDQDAGHGLPSRSGIMMRTQVPHPLALSTL